MFTINVRNVNEALPIGLSFLASHGVERNSRNGKVRVAPAPVTTIYDNPLERVLFSEVRDANPFFHFIESLWMLAGRNAVGDLTPYVARMSEFSDDKFTLYGAYGYRWRHRFNYDQLTYVVNELKHNPDSRRVVLSMWDPKDLAMGSTVDDMGQKLEHPRRKDVPCNTQVYFNVRGGRLDMTLLNRSNDVVWGAYGANAVHFSYLLEYVALGVGLPVGRMYQISNDYHVYVERPDVQKLMSATIKDLRDNRYERVEGLTHYPLISTDLVCFDAELRRFWREPDWKWFAEPFLRDVALPIREAHQHYRNLKFDSARRALESLKDEPWYLACMEWLARREKAHVRREKKMEQVSPCASSTINFPEEK